MTCRDISTIVASGQLPAQPWRQRVQVRFHLLMCRHCGRFWRQIRAIDRGLKHALGRMEMEGDQTTKLEQKIIERLRREE